MKKLLLVAFAVCLAAPVYGVQLNEWISNDTSTDDYEFIELYGNPGEDLTGLSIVLIEGESTKGMVDNIISLDGYFTDAAGYFVVGDALVLPDIELSPGWIENGGNTIILVSGLEADVAVGVTDVDIDDDCVEDRTIGTIVDAVGYGYGYGAADCITYFGAVPVGPDGNYDPAGAARCEGTWAMICMDGSEPAGTGCTLPDYEVGFATPGGLNDCLSSTATDNSTWGGVKSLYR
ncbi:hypothetical protein ACFL2Z_02015 [Candidatus Eisenbacteria bacterium]|uniref:LTD domain-containing protein n=1 Tax=Eiseniibacteriota bacterium TaxID=2212470 RepID=A0ABV6YP28_UNCEI